MTKREIIILCFFYSTVIFIGLVLILKKENSNTTSNILQAVTGIFSLFLTMGAVIYAYKAFEQQRRQNNFNEEQLAINRYEIQYSRALDLVFKQLEIMKEKVKGFQGNLNRLEAYKNIEHIPLFLRDIRPVIGNFNVMSHSIEQFLSRSTLHPNDQSYLYLFFSENLSPDFIIIPHRFTGHFEKLGNTLEEFEKNALDLYIKHEREKFIVLNPDKKENSNEWFFNMISNRDEKIIPEYIRDLRILGNMAFYALDARKRLVNPKHESKGFSFLKKDESIDKK